MKIILLTTLLCLALAAPAFALPSSSLIRPAPDSAPKDTVILLHGLNRRAWSLLAVKWSLEGAGYRVINMSYPSRNPEAMKIAAGQIDEIIRTNAAAGGGKINFVTHSLGGIVVRDYLGSHALTNLGRVVMLCPPNHGSEVADHLKKWSLGRLILGPIGCQQGTTATDMAALLGPAHFPVGVIAAKGPGIPFNCLFYHGPSDGIVSVESAKLEGMSDFLVVPGSHTFMILRADVLRQIKAFLRDGHFEAAAKPASDLTAPPLQTLAKNARR